MELASGVGHWWVVKLWWVLEFVGVCFVMQALATRDSYFYGCQREQTWWRKAVRKGRRDIYKTAN